MPVRLPTSAQRPLRAIGVRVVIALALLFTALSFAALSVYDRQALGFVGRIAPFSQVALTSFCAYAVGNIAGFGPLTGGTIRYRFYAPLGVSQVQP